MYTVMQIYIAWLAKKVPIVTNGEVLAMLENVQPGARTAFAKLQNGARKLKIAALGMVPTALIASTGEINFTEMTAMIEGIAGIMPAIQTLVMSVVPVILTLVLIGFVVGILTAIVLYVKGAIKF
jgi:hypothetical protein